MESVSEDIIVHYDSYGEPIRLIGASGLVNGGICLNAGLLVSATGACTYADLH